MKTRAKGGTILFEAAIYTQCCDFSVGMVYSRMSLLASLYKNVFPIRAILSGLHDRQLDPHVKRLVPQRNTGTSNSKYTVIGTPDDLQISISPAWLSMAPSGHDNLSP